MPNQEITNYLYKSSLGRVDLGIHKNTKPKGKFITYNSIHFGKYVQEEEKF
jgi:hypothetical protein